MNNQKFQEFESELEQKAKTLGAIASSLPSNSFFNQNPSYDFQQKPKTVSSLRTFFLIGAGLSGILTIGGYLAYQGNKEHEQTMQELRREEQRVLNAPTFTSTGDSEIPNIPKTIETNLELDFSSSRVQTRGIDSISLGQCYLENRYDNGNHMYLFRGHSYSFDFNLTKKPEEATLEVRHLSSAQNGRPGITPVTMYVNRTVAVRWNQLEAGFREDVIPIGKFLQEGKNTIIFSYDSHEGTTGYWQKYVKINLKDLGR